MQFSTRILLPLMLLGIAGCSTTPATVYKEEKFDSTNIYSRRFDVSSTVACEAVRRTLLSQGYVIGAVTANQVNGTKSFQPNSDAHVQIAFRVVCTDDDAKGDKSSVYVNALEDRYALKKVNNVASLGVGVLGSVSLPFSASDDSLVKVASETIASEKFYSRFFYLVKRFLSNEAVAPEEDPIETSLPPASAVRAAPVRPVEHIAPVAPPVAAVPAVPVSPAPVTPVAIAPAAPVTSVSAPTAQIPTPVNVPAVPAVTPAPAASVATPAPSAPAAAVATPTRTMPAEATPTAAPAISATPAAAETPAASAPPSPVEHASEPVPQQNVR